MKLKKLLNGLEKYRIFGEDNIDIKSVFDDSRKAQNGGLFIAIKGEHVNGNDFINDVIKKGAKAIVSEYAPESIWLEKVTFIKVDDAREALGIIAGNLYGNPARKLKIIGVTGSDGKTTTSHIIYEILREAGKNVGLISTISARIGNKSLDTGFHVTNPEALELNRYLSQMVKDGMKYAVLETTSHGIAQKRNFGIKYDVSVLTNITHEHLDYHKTFQNYRDTKLKLFLNSGTSVLNKDDESFLYFNSKIKGKKITYSLEKSADFKAGLISLNNKIMSFAVKTRKGEYLISTKLIGKYNAENILAAIAACSQFGIRPKAIQQALAKIKNPKGRLEEVKNDLGINIYIDFAHTPNSLKQVLSLLRDQGQGRVICVFGTASERDLGKRGMMGRVSTELADVSIFTAEDPRYEDINKILSEIESGAENKNAIYYKIPERGEAISFAINKVAKKGDTVVICGKAHETSMSYNGIEYPWSDFEAVDLATKGKTYKIKR